MEYRRAGISDNETFLDCNKIFFDNYYYEKISVEEIENKILNFCKESCQDERELHNAYFTIAYCEWKCGCLNPEILSAVQDIISNKKDTEYWKALNIKPKIIRRRERCLQTFLEKIQSVNPNPANRKLKSRFAFPLKKGDVFACFSKVNGCYGCGVVLDLKTNGESFNILGDYKFKALVAISQLTTKFLPTVEEIVSENALDVFWIGDDVYNLPKKGFIVIDNIADKIDEDYSLYFGSYYDKGRARCLQTPRPDFDALISKDENRLVKDKFSVPGRSIAYFLRKSNLKKTQEIINQNQQ